MTNTKSINSIKFTNSKNPATINIKVNTISVNKINFLLIFPM